LRKLCRYSARGFVVHAHTNGDSLKGVLVALVAEFVNLAFGRRCYLTFHAGVIQRYFPRQRAPWLVPVYWLLFAIPRRVICNSEDVRRCIEGYGIPSRKIVAIPAFSRQYLDFASAALPPALDAFFRRFPHVVFTYARMRPLFFPLTMIDGMALVMTRRSDVGLVLCGGLSHMEEWLWKDVNARIQTHGILDRICLIEDLDRETFLSALERSSIYLRTPITDGVASSVLESLALGTPVVAAENGTRPPGVITYPPEDAAALAAAVERIVANRADVVRSTEPLEVEDTLSQEVALLTGKEAG
jgi:glycosyltransferase involved in cell wall biosynthesis